MDILNVRPAEPGDVGKIWELLATYAHERLLLARPQEDIQEKLKNFRVGEIGGEFVCCLALRNFGGGALRGAFAGGPPGIQQSRNRFQAGSGCN